MNQHRACEILGVETVADLASIRLQYRRLASRFHPDRFQSSEDKAEATERFQEIAEAFLLLRRHAGDTDEQVELDEGPPPEDLDEPPPAPTWSSWTATAAKEGSATGGSFAAREDEEEVRRRQAWAALLPPLLYSPNVELLLDMVLLPSHLATALSRVLTRVVRDEVQISDEVAGLIGTLAGHLIPATIALSLGFLAIQSRNARSLAAIGFGCWWVISALLSAILDPEVTTQTRSEPRPR